VPPLDVPPAPVVSMLLPLLAESLPEPLPVVPVEAPPEFVPSSLLVEFVDVALESAFESSFFGLVLLQPHASGRTPRPRVKVRSERARRKSVKRLTVMPAREASIGPTGKCPEPLEARLDLPPLWHSPAHGEGSALAPTAQ
jgi:hypothetical protein